MSHSSLPTRTFSEIASMELLRRVPPPNVDLGSPAPLVMTDLADMTAASIAPHERLAQAEQCMVRLGTPLLLVAAQVPHVLGILTLADLQGEKPLRLVYQRQLTHEELCVADLMQPVSQLHALDHRLLARATVGQVVATLVEFGHPHLLVVEPATDPATHRIRGLVSQMQVERQLAMQLPSIEIASTFTEIEQALI
jgi:hypothetical protein